ncbi:MAG: hypothetical protein HDS16_01065 [Bacteroides sp.]|nr:hypothetical protein [Bacteroides sp.]
MYLRGRKSKRKKEAKKEKLCSFRFRKLLVSFCRLYNDNSIALWWGSDIMFINLNFPDIYLMWDAYYNIGIIHKNNRMWVKRQSRKEGQNENYLFRAVEKNTEQIEQEINRLISEYIDDTSKQISE